MPKTFEQLPTIPTPPEYPYVLPHYLAHMAMQHGPIFKRDWSDGHTTVYMVGPEANKFIMQTHRDHFSHDLGWTPIIGEFLGKGLLNTDDPIHAAHRKMMNPAFAIAYMSRYLPIMQRIIAERTCDWAARGVVDVYEEARKITFDVAAETLVGFHAGPEVDRLRELFYAILAGDYDPNEETEDQFWQRMLGTAMEVGQDLLSMIAERRATPPEQRGDDILAKMVGMRDDEGNALSDAQILGHVNILLVAGHETSTSLSSWLLYYLATHPDYRMRILAELDEVLRRDKSDESDEPITLEQIKAMHVLGNAVAEVGRLHAPAGIVPRGVVKEFEFNGYSIPVGTRVMCGIAASHYLPSVFEHPDEFDPDRFAPPREEDKRTPYSLVTFGGGPRICIGINFAQVEIKALAAHVLRAYELEPLPGQDITMAYFGPTGQLMHGLQMRARVRHPQTAEKIPQKTH